MLKGVSFEYCRSIYNNLNVTVNRGELCAGGEEGMDSCSGFSGGPLVLFDSKEIRPSVFYLVGIVSYGPRKCGTKDWPGVYTRFSEYFDWVLSKMHE